MPGFIGFWELIALGAVVLLLFGPKRLPEIGRSLGKGMREFKEGIVSPLEPSYEADQAPRADARFEQAPSGPRPAADAAAVVAVSEDDIDTAAA
ncbi:MAG: twin-arginine translocase TatA/TatE family subunit [Thermoleophilia bacterium]|nr:twin-arginine translocase TatA/TatE family subunit [Thermoleophilia bacterium]